jgi:hypothetical protein
MNTISEALKNAVGFFSFMWSVGKIQSVLMKGRYS